MSSEDERSSRRSKSKERGRSASRRTAKEETKPKGRSQRMMSVQRTDSEEEDSFAEMGENEKDFASSERLLVEIDQQYKELLEATRTAILGRINTLNEVVVGAGDWFDETSSLAAENQVKQIIRELEKQLLEVDDDLLEVAKSLQEKTMKQWREFHGVGESKPECEDPPPEKLKEKNRVWTKEHGMNQTAQSAFAFRRWCLKERTFNQ